MFDKSKHVSNMLASKYFITNLKFVFCLFLYALVRYQNHDTRRPVIIDTDYGYFIDDTFALSLALAMPNDRFDAKYIIATSHNPHASASCAWWHASRSGSAHTPAVGAGRSLDAANGFCQKQHVDFCLETFATKQCKEMPSTSETVCAIWLAA